MCRANGALFIYCQGRDVTRLSTNQKRVRQPAYPAAEFGRAKCSALIGPTGAAWCALIGQPLSASDNFSPQKLSVVEKVQSDPCKKTNSTFFIKHGTRFQTASIRTLFFHTPLHCIVGPRRSKNPSKKARTLPSSSDVPPEFQGR